MDTAMNICVQGHREGTISTTATSTGKEGFPGPQWCYCSPYLCTYWLDLSNFHFDTDKKPASMKPLWWKLTSAKQNLSASAGLSHLSFFLQFRDFRFMTKASPTVQKQFCSALCFLFTNKHKHQRVLWNFSTSIKEPQMCEQRSKTFFSKTFSFHHILNKYNNCKGTHFQLISNVDQFHLCTIPLTWFCALKFLILALYHTKLVLKRQVTYIALKMHLLFLIMILFLFGEMEATSTPICLFL